MIKQHAAAAMAAGMVLMACGPAQAAVAEYSGQAGSMFGMNASSFAVVDGDHLTKLGVRFNGAALDALPDEMFSINLAVPALPISMPASPINHVSIDYNPMGHPDMGVYDVPHFDFHFYTLTQAQRQEIVGPGFEDRALIDPGPDYRPAGYTPPMAPVPFMGGHIEPNTAPGTFDEAFLYGAWDGQIAFFEPMITTEYFALETDLVKAIPLPEKWALPYGEVVPTSYEISYDEQTDTYTVALLDFVPVPEPASAALLGIGGLLALRRRH